MISGPVLVCDDIITMYYAARAEYGKTPLEWLVGRAYWSAVHNLRIADGSYLWRPGIGAASPISLMGWPIRLVDEDSIQLVPQAATGATERLATQRCHECGDTTPTGAKHCIACGALVS